MEVSDNSKFIISLTYTYKVHDCICTCNQLFLLTEVLASLPPGWDASSSEKQLSLPSLPSNFEASLRICRNPLEGHILRISKSEASHCRIEQNTREVLD